MAEHLMETTVRTALWQQFSAAIDMLENALLACPETRLPGASLDRRPERGRWDLLGDHLPHSRLSRPVSYRLLIGSSPGVQEEV